MTHPGKVTLLVSSGNGPGECRQAVAHTLDAIRKDATRLGVEIDISERPARHGPSSAIVVLAGSRAYDMAQAWEGVVLWRCQSSLRPKHRRKNWFVQVFHLEDATAPCKIDPSRIEMQALRAGGPGGQHQNTTASAIRARWVSPEGQSYAVVVRDERSQHRNRSLALARLSALVAADRAESEAAARGAARYLHHQLERGDPARVFEGPRFRPV